LSFFDPQSVRFRTVVEADAARNAAIACVLHGLDSRFVELGVECKAFFGAGGYASAAAFAVVFVYLDHCLNLKYLGYYTKNRKYVDCAPGSAGVEYPPPCYILPVLSLWREIRYCIGVMPVRAWKYLEK
jgi:hypothetical protein